MKRKKGMGMILLSVKGWRPLQLLKRPLEEAGCLDGEEVMEDCSSRERDQRPKVNIT